MARTFRRSRQMHPIADLNVTNLIDLGFTLLIIFMIATPMINQEEQTIHVSLPTESQSPQVKPDPNQKTENITVKADGTIALGGRVMTQAQLTRELAAYGGRPSSPSFHVRIEAKANAQQFVWVLDELKKNHLKGSIDTQMVR